MRILFVVLHYVEASHEVSDRQEKAGADLRFRLFLTCLTALHHTFGMRQVQLHSPTRSANTALKAEIDIVVCTTGNNHVLQDMSAEIYRHHETHVKATLLRYECFDIMRQGLGQYDYFCYLEDNVLITDPLFFRKLAWFSGKAGNQSLLLPNRFKQDVSPRPSKEYIEPELAQPLNGQDTHGDIHTALMGLDLVFQRVQASDPGCFFLNAEQMGIWTKQLCSKERVDRPRDPVEGAASSGIGESFKLYKTARHNAGFLEVRHLESQGLG